MNRIKAFSIIKRDLFGFFSSPIAYIVIALFLLVNSILFFPTFFIYDSAELRSFFNLQPILLALFIPALTMRLFAEERRSGTFESLLTLPVTTAEIVLGKLIATAVFTVIMYLPSLSYVITISAVGKLDPGPVLGGYIGSFLLGWAYAAVGLFASSLTKNQIIAFIVGLAISMFFTLVNSFLIFLPASIVDFLQYIGTSYHFETISRGLIDTRGILYFVSMITVFSLMTAKVIDERR